MKMTGYVVYVYMNGVAGILSGILFQATTNTPVIKKMNIFK